MNSADESRALRYRGVALSSALARLPADDAGGCATRLVRSIAASAYPTAGPVAVACKLLAIEVDEVEGAVPTLTPVGSPFVFLSLGSTPPAVGTDLLVELVAGYWVAR